MLTTIAVCLALSAGPEDWTALPLPSLCTAPPLEVVPQALWDGRHIRFGPLRPQPEAYEREPGARLPVSAVVQMLEEDARARGTTLEIARFTPLLLARGDEAAIAGARALLLELERASAAFEIDLEVVISPSAAPAGDGARAPDAALVQRRLARSGEACFFGARESSSFLASFQVEVAADSGVSEPEIGHVLSGTTLHLRAHRLDGGRRVHLQGLLDVAELTEIERFDPATSDLGVFQMPRVASAQAVFAGVVESGATLEVVLAGLPLAQPSWTLRIQASARPDAEAGAAAGFELFDLGFLGREPLTLPALRPGAGFDGEAAVKSPPREQLAISASTIAAALESRRGTAATARPAGRGALHVASDLLLVPRGDAVLVREARALIRGVEGLRSSTARLEVRHGSMHASLPLCEGFPARLAVLTERTSLVDYSVTLAPQTWMPVPEVAAVHDGLVLDLEPYTGFAIGSLWVAGSREAPALERDDAQLGRLQGVARNLRAEVVRLVGNAPERSVLDLPPGSGSSTSLLLRLQTP